MRQDIKRIKASEVKAGDVLAFHNRRMDYKAETVSINKWGQVKVTRGGNTGCDCFQLSDNVFIKLEV
jgi:hypothetical protein